MPPPVAMLFAVTIMSMFAVTSVAAFDAQGAANWARKCWNNQCPSCTCVPQASGYCPGSGASPTCGCTPFVSHSLREGGGWKHAPVVRCSSLNGILSSSSYWSMVGTEGGRIIPGDVIVMTPPGDKPMGHCCIGTAAGKMTCHNKNHLDVTVDGYGKVDAIWRHASALVNETLRLGNYTLRK